MTDTNSPSLSPVDHSVRAEREDATPSVDPTALTEGDFSVWPHNGRNLTKSQRDQLIAHMPCDQRVSIGDGNAMRCTAALLRRGLLRYVGSGFSKATSLTASGKKTARRVTEQEIAKIITARQSEDA